MRSQSSARLVAGLIVLLSAAGATAQGTFQNLNFESPIPPLVPDGFDMVPITNALPHWVGYINGQQQDRVGYNVTSIGSALIAFYDAGSGYHPFEGDYFVSLQPSFNGSYAAALAQLGTVPATAESVRFDAYGTLSVSFAGQQIPLSALQSTPTYTIYGGDVSGFAGQTGWLQFQGNAFLDNIFFSNQRVPEPGVLALSGLGVLLLGWCVLRRR